MNRRESRETTFALLYETEFHPEKHYHDVYDFAITSREIKENEYIKDVFFGTCENKEKIDKMIEKAAVDWRVDRMSKITLSIVRLCVYELLYSLDVPTNVALNEAVELTKEYDISTAPAFVNGIVNRVSKIIENPELDFDSEPELELEPELESELNPEPGLKINSDINSTVEE